MTTKISEAKFEALKSKLRELFELDKSDLDFGIYRIMAAKNKEITAFLDRHLKETVREVLESRGSDESTKLTSEIAKAREAAATAGFNPDDSPKVKELEEQYAKLGGSSTEELEADIYNHLLNFFSRYYDEGDFISKRFYKGNTYSIPYGGEEVTLHWANKDQCYIKSGDWHQDYRFRIEDKAVHFRLGQASVEVGNNKETDNSKRRFILAKDNPVDVTENTLTLRFEFRPPTEADEKRVDDSAATRIFGGGYDKATGRTKGDQRERFCADAELRALKLITAPWNSLLQASSSTAAKPKRTLLGKHLDHFTARNSFDYFVHRDLLGFLSRELDFYLKNEVLRIDDFELHSPGQLLLQQGVVKAIRRVATKIIALLSSIESFQMKLWRKKKFILKKHWLVTLGNLPPALREEAEKNQQQKNEWRQLYGSKFAKNNCDAFIVDTSLYPKQFQERLESIINSPFAAMTGILVAGDNADALSILSSSFRSRIDLCYIDPPYNTGDDSFAYKDEYMHSSWLSMIYDRVSSARKLLASTGVFFGSIDDNEYRNFWYALNQIFGHQNYLSTLVWKRRSASGMSSVPLSLDHEYLVSYAIDSSQVLLKGLAKKPEDYPYFDEKKKLYFASTDLTIGMTREQRPNQFFPIKNPRTGREYEANPSRVWRFFPETMAKVIEDDLVIWPDESDGNIERPRYKTYFDPENAKAKPLSSWIESTSTNDREIAEDEAEYALEIIRSGMNSEGGRALAKMFGSKEFAYPKPLSLIRGLVRTAVSDAGWVLDFFAGSATTGHAVIDFNRECIGHIGFILVERGEYAFEICKPRLKKAAFSNRWTEGEPDTEAGVQQLIQCYALESYEDALNNLPSPSGELFESMDLGTRESLITYSLDLELGPHLLNMDAFKDPWAYKIYAQLAGEDEVSLQNVDIVETFNYLIGLKVQEYGPIERYNAEFVRLPHGDDIDAKGNPLPDDKREGRLRVEGRLRRDAEGPYVYQRVEGELNDGNATRVLVIWRKLTDDAEKDAAVLEAWMARHRENTKERSDYREYHLIYLNGPITLPQPTQELRTVLPTEQTFKDRMFEDTEV